MNSYAARSVIHVPVPYNIKLHTVLRSPRFDYRVRSSQRSWLKASSPSSRRVGPLGSRPDGWRSKRG